jgi:hypothetical protein
MRQQEGNHDDNQLDCGDHKEGYGREEGDNNQEDLDKREERFGGVSVTIASWLEPGFAAVSC